MSAEDLAGLIEFGLTSLQARTYLALLKLGPCSARHVSSVLQTVRPEVYRVLHELSYKGLVVRSPGSPSTYTPLPAVQVVDILLSRFSEKFTALNREKPFLVGSLSSYGKQTEAWREQRFDLIAGGSNAITRHLHMVEVAKEEYVSLTSKFGLRRLGGAGLLADEFASAIRNAKQRGVRIRIISEIDKSNLRSARYLSKYAELRRLSDISFYIDLIDKAEIIFGPALSDEEASQQNNREADIWTNNAKFIEGMYAVFERLWKSAKNFESTEDFPETITA
ncbi:MAG: TrmB family transcriptional regulator [Candidatus Bathyarchaeia archaeon]